MPEWTMARAKATISPSIASEMIMSSYVIRLISPRAALACAAVLALAACERAPKGGGAADEINWARAALARNPQIEVVASDSETGVFTIRDKQTGAVLVVSLHDIAAGPAAQFKAMTPAAAPAPPALPEPTAVPQPPEPSSAPTAQTEAREPSAPAASVREQAAAPAQSAATGSGNYTIERTGGQLRVSGPGVSIVSSGEAAGGGRAELAQRTAEPIICEGRRMLHFDNRDVYVDGDAITVRDGCEMFITNSRIVASGTGVTVRNAVVHVSNSHIEGAGGSFDVDADSKMYVRSSTFQGLSRRAELAMVQDQGGNRWR
jgi:hypothetical protein